VIISKEQNDDNAIRLFFNIVLISMIEMAEIADENLQFHRLLEYQLMC